MRWFTLSNKVPQMAGCQIPLLSRSGTSRKSNMVSVTTLTFTHAVWPRVCSEWEDVTSVGVVAEVRAQEMVRHLYGKMAYWLCARPWYSCIGDVIIMRVWTHIVDDTSAECVCALTTNDTPAVCVCVPLLMTHPLLCMCCKNDDTHFNSEDTHTEVDD